METIMPNEIQITPEIGSVFKVFRTEHKVTAKYLVEKLKKASTYFTKFEKGDIKKIESKTLIEICEYITKKPDTEGVKDFVNKMSENYENYTPQTQNAIMNIDDLLCLHQVNNDFINCINDKLAENNFTITDLTKIINSNEDINNLEGFDNFPTNEWVIRDNDINKSVIKLSISNEYLTSLLSGNIKHINYVIAEGILYYLYKLIGVGEQAPIKAHEDLRQFKIRRCRSNKTISIDNDNYEELDKYFGGLEPQVSNSLKNIAASLRIITTVTKEYGAKRVKLIEDNCDNDLGFYFAYISNDLSELSKKTKQTKQNFFKDLKQLIAEYSEKEKESLDIYLDE